MRTMTLRLLMAGIALLAVSGTAHAQDQNKPAPTLTIRPQGPGLATGDERQKKLLADADKLLVMAQSLKGNVDKTRTDEISVKVLREADEIEKFAKSVKDRPKS
jgi:hypothetical protein